MSEQINKVLASTAQSFTTAEQKQARDNIGAASAGDYAYNSALSSYVPFSAVSADANSAITSINGSSVGRDFSGVSVNNGITGDGMPNNPIGLSSTVMFKTSTSATKVGPAAVTAYNHLSTSILGPGYVNTESVLDRGTATLSQSALRFFDSAGNTATCDASSIDRWNSYSAATKVVSRSYPYTDAVEYTGLTIYNPYQTYGASVQDPSSQTIGYFVPKYMAPADLGKVLTVVSDDGYRCEWKDPTGGVPEINPMGQTTVYLSNDPEYLTMEDGVAYWIETTTGGSFTVHLGTQSTRTIHNKIYLVGTQANCVTMTIVYEDESGLVQQLNFVYGDTQYDTVYALDVYSRKVTISNGHLSFTTTMCRVYDYPCQTRDYFSSDNNNIGIIGYYVE